MNVTRATTTRETSSGLRDIWDSSLIHSFIWLLLEPRFVIHARWTMKWEQEQQDRRAELHFLILKCQCASFLLNDAPNDKYFAVLLSSSSLKTQRNAPALHLSYQIFITITHFHFAGQCFYFRYENSHSLAEPRRENRKEFIHKSVPSDAAVFVIRVSNLLCPGTPAGIL